MTCERAVKCDFGLYIQRYYSPNENFEYGYPHSNALLQSRLKLEHCKLHKAACHPMKCDVINDVKLFQTIHRRIYCRKFLTLSNQMWRYKRSKEQSDLVYTVWYTLTVLRNSYFQFLPWLVQVQTDSKLPDSCLHEKILLKTCVLQGKKWQLRDVTVTVTVGEFVSCETTKNIDNQSSRLILDYWNT